MKLFVVFVSAVLILEVKSDYWSQRDAFIKREESRYIGHKLNLTDKENVVNKILMQAKIQEFEYGFKHPELFPPARHFFNAKEDIEKSAVFKLISKMPKGGALHIHDTGLCSPEYILRNITYREHLYACIEGKDIKFAFADPKPSDDCWKLVKTLREEANSVEEFDKWLKGLFTLETDKPYEKYPDVNAVWKYFQNIFSVQFYMLTYQPVFLDYFYNALEEFYKDNVNYVELRGSIPYVYGLSGWPLNPIQVLGMLKNTADLFMQDHPDFIGIKYIYSPGRNIDNESMYIYLELFKQMKEVYPDFLVGFDLVGQEDLGQPLSSFIELLTEYAPDTKYFFHAGETNWNGMSTDYNLVDAVLLNTSRIGHGYALLKHPEVLEEVKRRNIAIEINPISHQVLNLVKDLRNHPGSFLFAADYPVVVSSDDPGMWGAAGLSYDFYEAFMGLASKSADLKMLKQLALNSLKFSALNGEEKENALKKFDTIWNKFIDEVYQSANSMFY